jgi:hypothetical protein
MSGFAYRLWVDDQPASAELSRAIDEIQVDQLIGAPWEAQLHIPICMDDRGQWSDEAERFLKARTRFRVDLRAGADWIPLIDGPTVGVDLQLGGDPGQSAAVVMVHDDSVALDRERSWAVYAPGRALGEIVRELFRDCIHDENPEVAMIPSPASPDQPPPSITRTGSAYEFLRDQAHQHGMLAYVLPGETPGRSHGVFGALESPSGDRLPTLVLAGNQRNVTSFQASTSSSGPGRIRGFYVDIGERTVTSASAQLRDQTLLGDEAAVADEEDEAPAEPGVFEVVDPTTAAAARLARDGYVITASGSVEGRCYPGVLRPYRYVDVIGINAKLSGTYLVQSVTHNIDRAGYRQSFNLWRNALSAGSAASGDALARVF